MDDSIAGLTPSEQAYFDTKGESVPEAPAEPVQPQEAKPVPETVDSTDAPQEPTQEAKTVPLGALHEERSRRKEAEKAMRSLREEFARVAGQLDVLKGVAPQTPVAPKPTVADAPIETLESNNQWIEEQKAEKRALAEFSEFRHHVSVAEAEFAAKTPDFQAAVDFLYAGRLAEMKAIGYPDQPFIDEYGVRQPSAGEIVAQEAIGISSTAFQQRVNPAERFYALAKARGYTAKAPDTTAEVTEGNRTAAALEKAADKLATIAKGQQAAKSLSSAGGASSDDIGLAALADMDMEEFERATANPKFWKRVWTQQ